MASTNSPENAFQLIEDGNSFQKQEQWWEAANSYGQAMRILEILAKDEGGKEGSEMTDTVIATSSKEEQEMIRKLYDTKRMEYLDRARNCFIKALTNEDEQDQTRRQQQQPKQQEEMITTKADQEVVVATEPLCATLSEEKLEKRLQIFANLYAKNEIISIGAMQNEDAGDNNDGNQTKEDEDLSPEDKEKSLEDRLRELNDSLPSELKTSKQRMVDIDKGLRRLGLSFYTKEEKEKVEQELDEDEQVEQILNQAKDEVLFERKSSNTMYDKKSNDCKTKSSSNQDSDSEDDDDDGDDDAFEAFEDRVELIGERNAAKEKIEEAQVKLAEFMALLESKAENDDSESAEIKCKSDDSTNSMATEQEKQMLLKAKRCIQKALSVWSD